ncbi:fumarate hydratase [Parvibacter caecicola]|uniref:fumarate hydratase n=1 Tax=Parvibacter caecicola TaxID=747645 RepID=UPI00272F42A8|nr:fumarate hydratase [Parvibacter caecicola]
METIITKETVARAVEAAIGRCACQLRPDMLRALEEARAGAGSPREGRVLDTLRENAAIAAGDRVPLCQDTGTVWVCLEVGQQLTVPGNVFSLVDSAVARAYEGGRLRMSVLRDALFNRTNTADNTPAFCELKLVPGASAKVHVLLKGGGSDNASRVVMLPPGAGQEGVRRVVLDCVREKAANACPPLVVGVGVGATFDKVAGLAKHALLREAGSEAPRPEAAAFEKSLLEEVNALGIGPAALGGSPTAVAVHLETAPCHIAALPVAVNMGCSAMRSASVMLVEDGRALTDAEVAAQLEAAFAAGAAPTETACCTLAPAASAAPSGDEADASIAGRADVASETGAISASLAGKAAEEDTAAHRMQLPLSKEDLASLSAGDEVLLSGPVYTMRDAGHSRALAHLEETGRLPFGLEGQTLFYAGPTPAAAGRPLGSVGPTTASRMDFATPALMEAGIVASIGKGKRAPEVTDACKATGGVYFCTIGGAAALLAKHVTKSELIGWEDLGTEALRRLELEDFPAFVATDPHGRDLYREVEGDETKGRP